jgi:hypothetical protein
LEKIWTFKKGEFSSFLGGIKNYFYSDDYLKKKKEKYEKKM